MIFTGKSNFGSFAGFSAAVVLLLMSMPNLQLNNLTTIAVWCFSICLPLSITGFITIDAIETMYRLHPDIMGSITKSYDKKTSWLLTSLSRVCLLLSIAGVGAILANINVKFCIGFGVASVVAIFIRSYCLTVPKSLV